MKINGLFKRINPIIIGCIFLLAAGQISGEENLTLISPFEQAIIYMASDEAECVKLAVNDLVADVEKITGKRFEITNRFREITDNAICIGTISNPSFIANYRKKDLDISSLNGFWEKYMFKSVNTDNRRQLIIAGSDERGTMFGIYDFIEKYLGVDPLYYWSGIEPEKKDNISIPEIHYFSEQPAFRFRGWFINDEDLLSEWKDGLGRRNIDYPYYSQVVAPEVMERVVEALVRLKFNLIIPASFLDIGNPAEEELVKIAARRGVFISQHHIEPLGVSAFTFFNYWKAKDGSKPLFSYYSSKEKLMEVWTEYARKWTKYPNVIWQIGLRGVGDRPMWLADPNVPQSDADRGKIISDALVEQMRILKSIDKKKELLVTTTLWAEGSWLFNEGFLQVPEEVIIVFSDNSPGWKLQEDFYSVKREAQRKYGVYYHHQLWGSGPHLAQGVPPSQTWKVLKEAVSRQSNEFAIMNVSNVREFVLGLDASSHMLYNFKNFDTDLWFKEWCNKRFPSSPEVKELYENYFSSFKIDDLRQVPILLDGQSHSAANTFFREISLYFNDLKKFREQQMPKPAVNQNSAEQSWGARSLGDMHPKASSWAELLKKACDQRQDFSEIILQTERQIDKMQSAEAEFLRANLLSHALFMRGLSQRLEYMIKARIALDNSDKAGCIRNLELARECFSDFRKAKIFCSEGMWKDWYIGDKKMNLSKAESDLNVLITKAKEGE